MGSGGRYWVGGHGGLGANGCSACEGEAGAAQNRRGALGWDTNFTWLQSRSGQLDKRPALEYLVGIDRHTGAYIPELAEKWDDGARWQELDHYAAQGRQVPRELGEFTARDVRHAVFLITQPESVQTDAGFWRTLMGIREGGHRRGRGQES